MKQTENNAYKTLNFKIFYQVDQHIYLFFEE